MNTNLFKTLALSLLMALMAIVTSCSGDNAAIQETIPASASVAVVDGEKLLKALDAKMENGTVVFPSKLAAFNSDAETMQQMAKIFKMIDYKAIYVVMSNDFYATFTVKDSQGLVEELEGAGFTKMTACKGFDAAYAQYSNVVLLSGSQAWMGSGHPDSFASAVTADIKAASDGANYANIPTVSDLLAKDDAVIKASVNNASLAALAPGMAAQDSYSYLTLNVKDNALSLDGKCYDRDGNPVKATGIKTIDTNFLRYVPGSYNGVMAVGMDKSYNWDLVFNAIASVGDFQTVGIAEMLKPYCKSIDGTVALAVEVPTGDQMEAVGEGQLDAVPFIFMAKMGQDKINEALETITKKFQELGIPYQTKANGTYAVTSGKMNFEFGSIDGYLSISSITLKPNANNNYTNFFKNKTFGTVVQIPSLAAYGLPMPYGVDFSMSMTDEAFNVTLKLMGTDDAILPTLIGSFMGL